MKMCKMLIVGVFLIYINSLNSLRLHSHLSVPVIIMPEKIMGGLKNPPVIFINDTLCGLVRHLECRDPDTAQNLWEQVQFVI